MPPAARIGPNAILQVMAVLQQELGSVQSFAILKDAGLARYAALPPHAMVDEAEVQALHRVLREALGTEAARAIGRRAGLATGDYLLAHRIPRPMRALLPRLPAALAAWVLLAAIRRHAWTFCGSGRFSVKRAPGAGARPILLELAGSATSQGAQADGPVCDYFAATFERLFQALVSPSASVRETACRAMGDPACVFELRW